MSIVLTDLAADEQRRFDAATTADERKLQGHFGTPPAIANFMAGMFSEMPEGVVRILDPGAGVGTLSAAVCQRVLGEQVPRHLVFELWENDPRLESHLRRTMEECQQSLRSAGHAMEFTLRADDFILANSQKSLFNEGPTPRFDLAILNPPYFKMRKESAQSRAMHHVVHGQPNIYAFFMAVAADLLVPQGELVAITPRSYFNGSYFKRFRQWFFERMAISQIHVFESRTEAFQEDAVLQENVILRARKANAFGEVLLTTSHGRSFENVERSLIPYSQVIDEATGSYVVRVSTSRLEHDVVAAIDSLPHRFQELGFEISTGPVVSFRATEFLREQRGSDTAPLLWMHNVRPFITQFPPKNGKPAHLVVSEESRRLLLPASRYVLLKRFTAKEEKRRLVAGIFEAGDSYSDFVGLENHLNYVYRKGSELTRAEALGLAAYFNSALVDRYFRAMSGNTQVNATEIRTMPVPDLATIVQIGEQMELLVDRKLIAVEQIVGAALGLSECLIDELSENAE